MESAAGGAVLGLVDGQVLGLADADGQVLGLADVEAQKLDLADVLGQLLPWKSSFHFHIAQDCSCRSCANLYLVLGYPLAQEEGAMTPNDVLAVLIEAYVADDLVPWERAQVLADVLEDHGRSIEAGLIRMRDRALFINVGIYDTWQINELHLLPKHFRRRQIRVNVEGMPGRCRPSPSKE